MRTLNYERNLHGGEPTWHQVHGKKKELSLAGALNWYSTYCDNKESKKYTLHFLKEEHTDKGLYEAISKLPEKNFSNIGFLCRIQHRGGPITKEKILDEINKLKDKTAEEFTEEEPKEVKNSVLDNTEEKVRRIIGELEGKLDDCLLSRNFSLFIPYEWFLSNNVKGVHTRIIKRRYEKVLAELLEAQSGKDPQLTEAYGFLKKIELKKYIALIQAIIDDLARLNQNAKKMRKPRKPKEKPVEKMVEKLSYKKSDNDLKLASVNPADIVGATQLWVYNTKTKKLGCYNSQSGLAIKGTTLQNFDEGCIQKTVRKPEITLSQVLKGGKIALRKILSELNSVEYILTGRINADTILLRVIK